ncbi:MAG: RNA 2',3'-cyclic phosphodiesterase [Anaerolineaceae bacterium]|nr:RNA 2',3'-cyclic phosphodiesterase [Anaerolineaceae bacterium]
MNHNDDIRAFIAIPLPNHVSEYLSNIIKIFKETFPGNAVKWVNPDNIHITLKFLGDVSKSNLHLLIGDLESKNQFSPFTLTLNKVGAFPSIYKPQVIWAGTTNHENLTGIVKFIERSTSKINEDKEPNSFVPHMTIARLRPGIKKDQIDEIKREIFKFKEIEPLSFEVNHYCVFQSILNSKGPIYKVLHQYDLYEKNSSVLE